MRDRMRIWITSVAWMSFLLAALVRPAWAFNWDLKENFPSASLPDTREWVKKYKPMDDQTPAFKPGDVLTFPKDVEKAKPFVPVEFWRTILVPGHQIKIRAPRDYTPHPDYQAATKKFGNQVKIGEAKGKRGYLMGYTAGLPFPAETIKDNDPDGGWKLVWNWEYRWQGFEGLGVGQWDGRMQTGAKVDRVIAGHYKKLYLTNRVDYADKNYTLPIKGAEKYHWKQWTQLDIPFDVKDTTFVQFRYNGATVDGAEHEEDGWAYIPALRRARRISMATRTDSFMGTELTIDDFYNFAGRPMDWDWKLVGRKKMLIPISDHLVYKTPEALYGPQKVLSHDSYELREQFMVDNFPRDSRHPYYQKILYIDTQTMFSFYMSAWDKKKELWKEGLWHWFWSEDGLGINPKDKGVRALNWNYGPFWDVQSGKATVFIGHDTTLHGAPKDGIMDRFPPDKVENYFDINRLIRGR